MVLQRETRTRKFKRESTTTRQLMTASIIHLQLIVLAQLWIYLPSPLMIDPPRIREPNMPQICSQLPFMLPLKTLLVPWPPLLIFQISFLVMFRKISIFWTNVCLWTVMSTEESLEYNNRTAYDCFNNPFTADCGSPAMHLPSITINDRPPPPKRARYAPNLLPATISVASEKSVSTLTNPSDLPDILPTDG